MLLLSIRVACMIFLVGEKKVFDFALCSTINMFLAADCFSHFVFPSIFFLGMPTLVAL